MARGSEESITELLAAWSAGDRAALARLVPLVEAELRRTARAYLGRERQESQLQTTAAINEVFVRLMGADRARWSDRTHFYAICARLMRQMLVDRARTRRAAKRGGGARQVPLIEASLVSPAITTDILAIDAALDALAKSDPRKAQVVELRFFGGLTVEETAEALKISSESVLRDWKLAKVWLLRELSGGAQPA
jgi:RNA polymerase sigma factor (TIGR02999 family)